MYSYRIHPEKRLCVFTGRGESRVEEFRTVSRAFLADVSRQPGWDMLFDLRGARIARWSLDRAQRAAELSRPFYSHIQGGRCAVVADEDVPFGNLRQFEALASDRPQEQRVFRNVDEACRSLGIDALPDDGPEPGSS